MKFHSRDWEVFLPAVALVGAGVLCFAIPPLAAALLGTALCLAGFAYGWGAKEFLRTKRQRWENASQGYPKRHRPFRDIVGIIIER